jgi:hypothetical protein
MLSCRHLDAKALEQQNCENLSTRIRADSYVCGLGSDILAEQNCSRVRTRKADYNTYMPTETTVRTLVLRKLRRDTTFGGR